jgi:PhnB protein
MPKRSLSDQLDQAIQHLLDRPGTEAVPVDPRLAPLLRLAADLRGLPREAFKVRLREELERRSSMTTSVEPRTPEKAAATSGPRGFRSVSPYIIVENAPGLIDFAQRVFGAEQMFQAIGSAGGIHAEIRIGDSMLMMGGGGPGLSWRGQTWPTALHVYVEDVDAAHRRALEAGAVEIQPLADNYGERFGVVKDPFGNRWCIAAREGETHLPEGMHSVNPYLHPLRSEPVISFLKRAFGAEQLVKYASPDGGVRHAKVRIGDAVVEMGDAHGPYQPMPTMFFLYVSDVDATYRRAIQAGATSEGEPAVQPYGGYAANVKDAFGNLWHLAALSKPVTA